MRFKWFAPAAACALLVTSVQYSADAKPKRPAASAAAKKKAAAAAAAKKEADRLAAEAAEKARIRAQWGVLADLPDGDYDANGTLVTVRREDNGNRVALTVWKSMARLSYSVSRNANTGALSYDYADAFNKAHYEGRVENDGSVEAIMKNETSWPILKRDAAGVINFAYVPGKKLALGALQPGGKAAAKLASLTSAGKIPSISNRAVATGAVPGGRDATPGEAGPSPASMLMSPEGAYANLRQLEGYWSNGEMFWIVRNKPDRVSVETFFGDRRNGEWDYRLEGGKLYSGDLWMFDVPGGFYYPYGKWSFLFQPDGSFDIRIGKRDKKTGSFTPGGLKSYTEIDGHYVRKTAEEARTWVNFVNTRVAQRQREKASGGNSGWLGGLIMGGVAAAAGGDASTVMGAAMKGVEMTTDNEMSRNVLAGQGDAMIQSSIDTQRQIAETERLRVAASEETRRKREAQASGRSVVAPPKAPVKTASAATSGSATSAPSGGGSSEEKLTKKTVRAYFWVSTVPGPNDTHNTHCQSSELSITIDWNPRGWGNQGRANDVLQPMIPAFLAKCSREAQVTNAGNATYFVEGLQYGYVVSPLKAGDVRVNMP